MFVRYEDLLTDWVKTTMHVGHTLDLQSIVHTRSDLIREVHRFIDPTLRRVTSSLDDLALPPRLHELTGQTWEELNKLADPDGDVTEVHATLDELRDAYTDLYEEAEAISKSSVVAARIAGARAAADTEPPEATGLADRIPHDVRAKIPPSVRRGVRKALGRERATEPVAGGPVSVPIGGGHGLTNIEGHTDFDIVWPWNAGTRCERGATAVLRVKNEADSMRFVLPPLLRACDHVLLVDNNSTDGTGEAALAVAASHGLAAKFTREGVPLRRRPRRRRAPRGRPSAASTRWPTSTTGASPTSAPATRGSGTATWSSPPRARCRWPTCPGRWARPTPSSASRATGSTSSPTRAPSSTWAAQHRGVGLPDDARLRLLQGARVGDPDDARP